MVSYPNQIWLGDIIKLKTSTGKLYLSAYIYLYSLRVMSWDRDKHMRSGLVETA